jgi:hypothetical protein
MYDYAMHKLRSVEVVAILWPGGGHNAHHLDVAPNVSVLSIRHQVHGRVEILLLYLLVLVKAWWSASHTKFARYPFLKAMQMLRLRETPSVVAKTWCSQSI